MCRRPAPGLLLASALCVVILVQPGCGEEDELRYLRLPLQAFCTVTVTGKGVKQMETDYLPHVVACENGSADFEALKAQAVAARSYTYYKIKKPGGEICDSQACQVYTCGRPPEQKHYDAVAATAGQVLVYSNVVICAFYVAGAKPSTATCVPLGSDPDPTGTEHYVTYNEGKTGSSVTQSSLGWVAPSNVYNRGCKSQNGAHCLSLKGRKYDQILKFYYGADIQLVTGTGSCVTPPPPPDSGPPPPDTGPPPPDTGPSAPDAKLPPEDGGGLDAPTAWPDLGPGADTGAGPGPGLRALEGGCRVGSGEPGWPGGAAAGLIVVALLLARRRRRRRW